MSANERSNQILKDQEQHLTQSLSDEQFPEFLLKLFGFVAFAGVFVIGAYIYNFRHRSLSTSTDDWGTFGDYIGGLMNPIIGATTVVLIIVSILIQRRELRASLAELRTSNLAAAKMSFEQSLFSWLANYHDLVKSVHIESATGRNALKQLYRLNLLLAPVMIPHNRRVDPYDQIAADIYQKEINFENEGDLEGLDKYVSVARARYQRMYSAHQSELDVLPRTLYRLLLWIDKSSLMPEEKWHYAALVRAQLSWTELAILFYNCYSNAGSAFADIANRYALFDNLDATGDILIEHITRAPRRAIVFPLQARAFSSALAKIDLGIASPSDSKNI